jgi:hypothetical protein
LLTNRIDDVLRFDDRLFGLAFGRQDSHTSVELLIGFGSVFVGRPAAWHLAVCVRE